ncbi:hypothetical protein ACIO3O_37795 [Streptomyces sp. NPDC087440]|uniref:hypothetical protein n=1 Tax=Streptomyces sp. NPDC087440 TaxID=3365790 RepID=UPI0037F509A9
MTVSYRSGDQPGGLDIVISLTPAQAKALGTDAAKLSDWTDTALWAIALMRSHQKPDGTPYVPGLNDYREAINDLALHLIPALEGVRDAAVRAHTDLGATIQELANAMDVSRSTAQSRREVVARKVPDGWEKWASNREPHPEPDEAGSAPDGAN